MDLKDACHIQVAPHHRRFLRFAFARLNTRSYCLGCPWLPHFYTIHGCGSLPSATDGNPHTQLPRWLAHSGPVAGGFDIAQDPPPQPLRLPGAQGQLCQEHTVTQSASFVPGQSYRLQMTATVSVERATIIQHLAASFGECTAHPLKAFQKILGFIAAASLVLQLGLLHMRPIQSWLKQRVTDTTA